MSSLRKSATLWLDSWAGIDDPVESAQAVEWLRIIPLVLLHVACLSALWVGVSPFALTVAVALYVVRMFAITGFYHRYFSHRSFKTSRLAQFVFALLGASAVQRGPIWWAAHHRHHHANSDREDDVHSPVRHSFLWSHIGWLTSASNFKPRLRYVPDLVRYPELRFLDRFDTLIPALLAVGLWITGAVLERFAPGLGTNGPQLFVWGFLISSVVLLHATCAINSLAHRVGWRRFETNDHSRNSFLLALVTLGEGWHNNHHHYPASMRQGFRWWELDLTAMGLGLLQMLGVIWDAKEVPSALRSSRKVSVTV